MKERITDKASSVREEWEQLDRGERIVVIWESSNLAATILLPLLLIFTFVIWAPTLPPVNVLLGLVIIGVIYGGSIIFQGPILNYYEIDEPRY